MERFEKIAIIENEVEALCLRSELEERGIPHAIQSHYDTAYDGLFQLSAGWGHVEAPSDRREEILKILDGLHQPAVQQRPETDAMGDDAAGSGWRRS